MIGQTNRKLKELSSSSGEIIFHLPGAEWVLTQRCPFEISIFQTKVGHPISKMNLLNAHDMVAYS